MSSLPTLETRRKKKAKTERGNSRPKPPIIKEKNETTGKWVEYAGWRLGGPSSLGRMAKGDYGVSRDQYLAQIWEKCQPEYFQIKMNEFANGRWSKKRLAEHFVDANEKLSGPGPPRNYPQKNGGMIGDIIQLGSKKERNAVIPKAADVAMNWVYSEVTRAKIEDWKHKPVEMNILRKMLLDEIKKRVNTGGGTADEEKDIARFIKTVEDHPGPIGARGWSVDTHSAGDTVETKGAKGQDLKKPRYKWDGEGHGGKRGSDLCCNLVHYDAFKDGRGEEKWLGYEWNSKYGWPGKMSAHLDGILIGKGKRPNGGVDSDGNPLYDIIKFFDVFEAKQRQDDKFVFYNGSPGKTGERLQCALYCMMLIRRPERLKWLKQGEGVLNEIEAKCGSWLLQTQRNSQKQRVDFIQMDEAQFDGINQIVESFLRDLNLTQAYHFEQGTAEYRTSLDLQERLCKSVMSPI
jgi:hypothetical protein